MEFSRRDFVSTGLVGAAGVLASKATSFQLSAAPLQPADEDGYKLWLRFAPPGDAVTQYRQAIRQIVVAGASPTSRIIKEELTAATTAMFGSAVPVTEAAQLPAVIVGTPKTSSVIRDLKWDAELTGLGGEGYRIRTVRLANQPTVVVASAGEIGALYGTYHFLRLLQIGSPIDNILQDLRESLHLRRVFSQIVIDILECD